jgi:hypothetical protein
VSGRVTTALAGGVGAAVGAGATLVARTVGADVPWSLPVVAGLVAGVLLALALHLPNADPDVTAPLRPAVPATTASFGDLGGLRFTVEQDSRDAHRFETRLRPRLTGLVVERLWQRHRLDWRAQTDRAAATQLLSPDLLALLTAPPQALRLSPKALARWTRDLENL